MFAQSRMNENHHQFLAGLIGTVAALFLARPQTIAEAFFQIIASVLCSLYFAPAFAAFLTEKGFVDASAGSPMFNLTIALGALLGVKVVKFFAELNLKKMLGKYTGENEKKRG